MQKLEKMLNHGGEHSAGYERSALQVRINQLCAEIEDLKIERDMYRNLYEKAALLSFGEEESDSFRLTRTGT